MRAASQGGHLKVGSSVFAHRPPNHLKFSCLLSHVSRKVAVSKPLSAWRAHRIKIRNQRVCWRGTSRRNSRAIRLAPKAHACTVLNSLRLEEKSSTELNSPVLRLFNTVQEGPSTPLCW